MEAVWKRIQVWLDANAPTEFGRLRPGAAAEEIQATENVLGLKLPADVKASYSVHDGQADEPGLIGGEGWCLMTLQQMVTWWQKWSKYSSQFRCCVPVGWGGAGDYVFLDLGTHAQEPGCMFIKRSDSNSPNPIAPSFRLWLEEFADTLENNKLVYSERDGCLMYTDEID